MFFMCEDVITEAVVTGIKNFVDIPEHKNRGIVAHLESTTFGTRIDIIFTIAGSTQHSTIDISDCFLSIPELVRHLNDNVNKLDNINAGDYDD